ncbi:MAG: muconolactone Delta-isomerase family protein [Acidimicrobiales bacterium]
MGNPGRPQGPEAGDQTAVAPGARPRSPTGATTASRRHRNKLDELLQSLPVAAWMAVETLPLTPHPAT